jgi:Flp pilus assembly protein TadD
MLDVSLFGMRAPFHHAVNLGLHLLNTVLLLVWLRKIGCSPAAAFWVTALFALHPTRVESVAWISERKDVLSAAWGLLALIAYDAWARRRTWPAYGASIIGTALALASKPMLVTLPCLFLVLDFLLYQRVNRVQLAKTLLPCLLEKIPLFILVSATVFMTVHAQSGVGAIAAAPPARAWLTSILAAYGHYGWTFILPWPLYIPRTPPAPETIQVAALGTLLAFLILTVTLIVRRREYPLALLGWLWFLGALVPVAGFVKAGEQFTADRYTYLAHIGLGLISAAAATAATRRWPARTRPLAVTALLALAALSALTAAQARHWQNSETLFRHTLAHDPGNATAHNNLGTALMETGRTPQALYHFQEAVRIAPGNLHAQNNLGVALLATGNAAAARKQFEALLRHTPDDPEAWVNHGAACLATGQLDEATASVDHALALRPNDPRALELQNQINLTRRP